jgi:hypothetical protein
MQIKTEFKKMIYTLALLLISTILIAALNL